MTNSHKLLKILIGVAWIDGQVQDVERDHILKIAQERGLADDPVINDLLNNMGHVPVQLADCQRWIHDYLGSPPSTENYQQLLEALSNIVYSDNDVANAEAQLLMSYQQIDPQIHPANLSGNCSTGGSLTKNRNPIECSHERTSRFETAI
jgi:uncharacterized tellurite resistance protein B-like protein